MRPSSPSPPPLTRSPRPRGVVIEQGAQQTPSVNARQPGSPLWLHVHFPQLPLEVLTRGMAAPPACVLGTGEGRRSTVWKANARAAILGIKPGMSVAAAHALGQVTVLERNERAEQRALAQLCQWAIQFSPVVSPVPGDGLVVEIGASLKLYRGLDSLLRHLRRGMKELGYRMQYAVAPVPLAATVLARAGARAIVWDRHELARELAGLPLTVLDLAAGQCEALERLGVHRVGDCRRLPRAGLARRFSPALLDMLDRLYGVVPDPRPALPVPRSFESLLELPWEVRAAPALLTAGERLLHELVGYLRANAAVTRRLHWRLLDSEGRHSRFELALTHAGRDMGHLLLLLRETLARLRLDAPVRALELRVTEITHGASPGTADLFRGGHQEATEAYAEFVDRMRSRCGDGALHGLQEKPDRRPEHAWSWRQPELSRRTPKLPLAATRPAGARPVWLVKPPRSLRIREGRPELGGPLSLMPERERIEGGWWSGDAMARDYFIATTATGSRVWIYRELAGARRWFLHGVFE